LRVLELTKGNLSKRKAGEQVGGGEILSQQKPSLDLNVCVSLS